MPYYYLDSGAMGVPSYRGGGFYGRGFSKSRASSLSQTPGTLSHVCFWDPAAIIQVQIATRQQPGKGPNRVGQLLRIKGVELGKRAFQDLGV